MPLGRWRDAQRSRTENGYKLVANLLRHAVEAGFGHSLAKTEAFDGPVFKAAGDDGQARSDARHFSETPFLSLKRAGFETGNFAH
jgi:hypothetical protein